MGMQQCNHRRQKTSATVIDQLIKMKLALSNIFSLYAIFLLTVFAKRSPCFCTSGRCESTALSLVDGFKRDTALVDHVFKKIFVLDQRECYMHCVDDCWCLSYNYKRSEEKQNCELNEANSQLNPEDLTQTPGVDYYEPSRSYPEETADRCGADSCSNGCCRSSPCLHGGACKEVCDPKQRRFNCTDCSKGYGGHRCQTKLKTCKDLLSSGFRQNGIHTVYDQQDKPFKVFCDFTSESGAAWTLIMSHTLSNNGQFKNPLFLDDLPINENAPEWNAYRLSKPRMLSIRQKSTHWRATCNFPTTGVDFRDYIRASLGVFDIMATSTSQCRQYELVNIRGIECTACTAYTLYSKKYPLHIDSDKSSDKGCAFNGKSGVVPSEDNFGYYVKQNSEFRCSSSPSSTTQFWIGTR